MGGLASGSIRLFPLPFAFPSLSVCQSVRPGQGRGAGPTRLTARIAFHAHVRPSPSSALMVFKTRAHPSHHWPPNPISKSTKRVGRAARRAREAAGRPPAAEARRAQSTYVPPPVLPPHPLPLSLSSSRAGCHPRSILLYIPTVARSIHALDLLGRCVCARARTYV